MKRWKWVVAAIALTVVMLVVQAMVVRNSARSKAIEECATEFDARFSGDHAAHLQECEQGFRDRGQ